MPQLVKGGKWVYGLCEVGISGEFSLPPDAQTEYGFIPGQRLFATNASRTSGGFVVCRFDTLKRSGLTPYINAAERLMSSGESSLRAGNRTFVAAAFDRSRIVMLPLDVLEVFGVKPGDLLVVVRGSYLGISFLVRGPIVFEARTHPELPVYMSE